VSRITLVGERRHGDPLLPSPSPSPSLEPVGRLLPEVPRPGRWGHVAVRGVAGGAVAGWALGAAVLARQEFAARGVAVVLLLVAALACGAGTVAVRKAEPRAAATALLTTGGALGVCGVWSLGDAQDWSAALRLAGVAGVVAVASLLLGWCSSAGRGGVYGAGAVVVGTVCWELALGAQSAWHAGASIAAVSVVALGLLPRFALTAAGLSGLDDRRSGAASVSRHPVATALAATHRELAPATVVTAASAAVGTVLALRTLTVWTVLFAVTVAVVLGLRARAYPLVPEVVALLGAAAVIVVRLAWVWAGRGGSGGALAVVGAAAVVGLGVLVVRPTEQVRLRARRLGELLESVGVIALFPLVIGVFA